jgi:hypothetical protein
MKIVKLLIVASLSLGSTVMACMPMPGSQNPLANEMLV